MTTQYTEMQLDALREVANIGSGNAATALAAMLGRPVDLSCPYVYAKPLAEAVESVGPAELEVTAILIQVIGDLETMVVLMFNENDSRVLCEALGVEAGTEVGVSALCEIGNILGASYLSALAMMTGIDLEPAPPIAVEDMLGAILSSVLALGASQTDTALLLDSRLLVEGSDANFSFMFLVNPGAKGIGSLLERLGLGS
ncbi:MAG: chemotaxis protein CheC [Thermoleophilia bacterium]